MSTTIMREFHKHPPALSPNVCRSVYLLFASLPLLSFARIKCLVPGGLGHPKSPSGKWNDLQEHHKHTPTLPLISDCVYAQPRWRTIRACDAQQTATLVTQPPACTFTDSHMHLKHRIATATAYHSDDGDDKR